MSLRELRLSAHVTTAPDGTRTEYSSLSSESHSCATDISKLTRWVSKRVHIFQTFL